MWHQFIPQFSLIFSTNKRCIVKLLWREIVMKRTSRATCFSFLPQRCSNKPRWESAIIPVISLPLIVCQRYLNLSFIYQLNIINYYACNKSTKENECRSFSWGVTALARVTEVRWKNLFASSLFDYSSHREGKENLGSAIFYKQFNPSFFVVLMLKLFSKSNLVSNNSLFRNFSFDSLMIGVY